MQLYDTAKRQVVPLAQRDPGRVSIYVCGPTVYAPPHIGHGRQVLVYDVLWRFLEWSGLEVTFVSNVTDIDDAIIERANREDRDPADIARKCEVVWWEAMDRVGVRRPHHVPHATEYVEQMVALIGQLVDAGKAYVTSDGVYLSVEGSTATACCPTSTWTACVRGAASARSSARRSATPPTSSCGSWPSRASPTGPHRGATAGPAGTPSAW